MYFWQTIKEVFFFSFPNIFRNYGNVFTTGTFNGNPIRTFMSIFAVHNTRYHINQRRPDQKLYLETRRLFSDRWHCLEFVFSLLIQEHISDKFRSVPTRGNRKQKVTVMVRGTYREIIPRTHQLKIDECLHIYLGHTATGICHVDVYIWKWYMHKHIAKV